MTERPSHPRRRYFINRKFQIEFSLRFLLIIAVAAIAVMLLFFYNSRGTLTAGYSGTEVKLLQTSAYFLPSLIISTIVIAIFACLTGTMVMILLSHRLAGPLFRFQASLDELRSGKMTLRINLREKDQFKELAVRVNALAEVMDGKIGDIKDQASKTARIVADLQSVPASQPALLQELADNIAKLQETAGYFQTSPK